MKIFLILVISFGATLHILAYNKGTGRYADVKQVVNPIMLEHRVWANKRIRT